MSENTISDDGSSVVADSMIQRQWNQFANPDLSIDSGSLPTFLAPTPPSSTDQTDSSRQSSARRFRIRGRKGREGQFEPPV
jgi:hypothetical protein